MQSFSNPVQGFQTKVRLGIKPRRTNQDDEQAHVCLTGTHMLFTLESYNNLSHFSMYDKIKRMKEDYVPNIFNNSTAVGIIALKNISIAMVICIIPFPSNEYLLL
ncbi:hypothetical protein NPM06_17695 [Bacillus cereus]|uniref:hypothetical protein n=1 Tax=Bacillus cereus TaxID=1396 RepID=UPI002111276D|nr:hypothetical protein [Bacillus cereus]